MTEVLVGGRKREAVLQQRRQQLEEEARRRGETPGEPERTIVTQPFSFVDIGRLEGHAFTLEVQASCDYHPTYAGFQERRFSESLQYILSGGCERHLNAAESMELAIREKDGSLTPDLVNLQFNMYLSDHPEWVDVVVERWIDGSVLFLEGVSGVKDGDGQYSFENLRTIRSAYKSASGILTFGAFNKLETIIQKDPSLAKYLYGRPADQIPNEIIETGGIYLPEQGVKGTGFIDEWSLLMRGGQHGKYSFRATTTERAASRGCRLVNPFNDKKLIDGISRIWSAAAAA